MGQQGLSVKYCFMKRIILAIRKFFANKETRNYTDQRLYTFPEVNGTPISFPSR